MDEASSAAQDNAAQIAYWNDKAAVTWTTFQERIDALLAPLTAIAVAAAAPADGEHVIDVGCGCGETVLELAHRLGPSGHVLGVDVSEAMSARARERIAAQKLANADVIIADAATYAFPPAAADLLFSRFGVMFFADPSAAFANLRRAMRPGGRLLCMVWRAFAENPWANVPFEAARHLLPPTPPPDPDAAGPFAWAAAERARRILADAGWRDITLARHDVLLRLAGAGQIEAATEFATRVGPLARALAEADRELRLRARQAVANALQPHDRGDGISLSGSVWIVGARA